MSKGLTSTSFSTGNSVALKHGATSALVVTGRAAEVLESFYADPSTPSYLLDDSSFLPAVYAWARAEAKVLILSEWLEDQPLAGQTEGSFPRLELLRRWEQTAATHRQRLGLDPVSRSKILREIVSTTAIARGAGIEHLKTVGAEVAAARNAS